MNTRDLGIGAGKGDKSRVTSVETYRARFPDVMGPAPRIRSICCEAPVIVCPEGKTGVSQWFECTTCKKACDAKACWIV